MPDKLTIRTTITGTIEIGGEEVAVRISTSAAVTAGDYMAAIKAGIAEGIGRAIANAFETTRGEGKPRV